MSRDRAFFFMNTMANISSSNWDMTFFEYPSGKSFTVPNVGDAYQSAITSAVQGSGGVVFWDNLRRADYPAVLSGKFEFQGFLDYLDFNSYDVQSVGKPVFDDDGGIVQAGMEDGSLVVRRWDSVTLDAVTKSFNVDTGDIYSPSVDGVHHFGGGVFVALVSGHGYLDPSSTYAVAFRATSDVIEVTDQIHVHPGGEWLGTSPSAPIVPVDGRTFYFYGTYGEPGPIWGPYGIEVSCSVSATGMLSLGDVKDRGYDFFTNSVFFSGDGSGGLDSNGFLNCCFDGDFLYVASHLDRGIYRINWRTGEHLRLADLVSPEGSVGEVSFFQLLDGEIVYAVGVSSFGSLPQALYVYSVPKSGGGPVEVAAYGEGDFYNYQFPDAFGWYGLAFGEESSLSPKSFPLPPQTARAGWKVKQGFFS